MKRSQIKKIINKLISGSLAFLMIFSWAYDLIPGFGNFSPETNVAEAANTKIRQEINIQDGYMYVAANSYATSSAIINIDPSKYSGAAFYFEVVASTTAANDAVITLRNATSSAVLASVTVNGTSYARYRSGAFAPSSMATDYVMQISNANVGKGITAARVIVLQDAATLSSTQTQIEIGSATTTANNTATLPLQYPKYWYYDSTKWDGSPTFYAAVTYKNTQVASTTSWTTAGTYTNGYQVSKGTSYITIEAWGGGGAGGSATGNSGARAGGGAGGQYARSTTTAVENGTHTLVVGAVSTAATNGVVNGKDSTYDSTAVVAKGGAGGAVSSGTSSSGGAGSTTGGVGQVVYAGGNGGNGTVGGSSGGGGGGAGSTGTGNSGSGATQGGAKAAGGGAGGAGVSVVDTRNAGNQAGGGGSGGLATASTNIAGGNGAAGMVNITETHGKVGIAIEESADMVNWSFAAQIVYGASTSTAVYATSTTFTPKSGYVYRLVASTTNAFATYDVYNAKIIVDQTSPTKLQPQYLINNTLTNATGLVNGAQTLYDPNEWGVVNTKFFHQIDSSSETNGSTDSAKLQSNVTVPASAADITNSTATGANRATSTTAGMTMPAGTESERTIGDNVLNAPIYASRILVDVTPNMPPAVVPNTADAYDFGADTTPTFEFTGTDPESNDVRYNVQILNSISWQEDQLVGAVNLDWDSSAVSGDRMIAAVDYGRLYSFDGTSWKEETPAGAVNKGWETVDISGNRMMAAIYGGRLYSYDGVSWKEETPAGAINKNWDSVAVSGDKMAAAVSGGRLYYYNGSSWSEQQPAGAVDKSWDSLAISGDKIVAGVNTGRLYYYNGSSWSEQQPAGAVDTKWGAVSISGDKMIATNGARLYSYNGTTWKEEMPVGAADFGWVSVAISGDKMMATDGLRLYVYNGISWQEETPAGAVDKSWDSIDISGDNMVASEYGGRLYSYRRAVVSNKVSGTDGGFAGSPDNSDPFSSGQQVGFTVQSGSELSTGTYYWRARATDPSGSGTYGSWSATRSFTITNGSPTVVPNTADAHDFGEDSTPTLEFTGTDSESNDARYNLQVSTLNTFDDWREQQPAGIADIQWNSSAVSGDKMIAAVNGGRLYYYDGDSWSEQQPEGDYDVNWGKVAISGNKMLAAVTMGRLYYYDGASWTEVQPAGDVNAIWNGVSISGDKMVAAAYGGRLYYYNGSSWSEQQPAGNSDMDWISVSISGDKMIAAVSGGRLYYYNGVSWTEQQIEGNVNLNWVSVSISGDKMMAAVYGGRLYYYNGYNWFYQEPAGAVDLNWQSVSISGDKMVAAILGGRLYYYDGTSWAEVQPAGNADKQWQSVSISGDKIIAAVALGRLYAFPFMDKISGSVGGFVNTVNGADTDPFTSAQKVSFTIQAGDALPAGTYYWRVRGTDPTGSNTYGSWTTTRSFTITAAVPGLDLSGVVYTSEGGSNIGIGKTVNIYKNGSALIGTDTTDANGSWSATVTPAPGSGDIVTVYVDNDAVDANLVYVSDGLTQSNLDLYGGALIARNDTGTGITNSNLQTGAVYGEADMVYSTSTSNGILINPTINLTVPSGSTYSNTASTTLLNGNLSVAGTVSGTGNLQVNGGSVTGAGTINVSGGTFLVDGTGIFGGNGNWTFNNLTFGDGAGVATTTSAGTGSVTAATTTIALNQKMDAGVNKTWNLTSSFEPFKLSGTLLASSSTFIYKGINNATVTPATYYNLEISPTAGTPVFQTVSSSVGAGQVAFGGANSATLELVQGLTNYTLTPQVQGSNMVMIVGVVENLAPDAAVIEDPITATYDGVALTGGYETTYVNYVKTRVWVVKNPASNKNFTLQWQISSKPNKAIMFYAYYTGVDQTTSYRTPTIDSGTTNPATLSVTNSQPGDLVVGVFGLNDTTATDGFTEARQGSGQQSRWTATNSTDEIQGAIGGKAGAAGTNTFSWDFVDNSYSGWGAIAIPLIPVQASGNDSLQVQNDFTIAGAGNATFDANTHDIPITIGGNLSIDSGDTFSASDSGTLTLGGNLSNSGTFTHNNGTLTLVDPNKETTISSAANMSFYNMSVTTPGKVVKFGKHTANVPTFSFDNLFTVTGAVGNWVSIWSDAPGNQWLVDFNVPQTAVTHAFIRDSGCVVGSLSVAYSGTNSGAGNNGRCWNVGNVGSDGTQIMTSVEMGSGSGVLRTNGGSNGGSGSVEAGSGGGAGQGGGGQGGGTGGGGIGGAVQ